jgi:hypothetical protein
MYKTKTSTANAMPHRPFTYGWPGTAAGARARAGAGVRAGEGEGVRAPEAWCRRYPGCYRRTVVWDGASSLRSTHPTNLSARARTVHSGELAPSRRPECGPRSLVQRFWRSAEINQVCPISGASFRQLDTFLISFWNKEIGTKYSVLVGQKALLRRSSLVQ